MWGPAQRLTYRTGSRDVDQPGLLQLLPGVVADHGRNDRPASFERCDDSGKLPGSHRMVGVEGAVSLDGNLSYRLYGFLPDLIDQKAFGVAEVLVDLGPDFWKQRQYA